MHREDRSLPSGKDRGLLLLQEGASLPGSVLDLAQARALNVKLPGVSSIPQWEGPLGTPTLFVALSLVDSWQAWKKHKSSSSGLGTH